MNRDKMMETLTTANFVGRIGMGIGAGLFIRKVTKHLMTNATLGDKVATWFGAVGHAIDCYFDNFVKIVVDAYDMTHVDEKAPEEWGTLEELGLRPLFFYIFKGV